MRILTIGFLTMLQFTVLPFLSIVAANSERQVQHQAQHVTENVTTIFKSASM